jgi:hypothetical protein
MRMFAGPNGSGKSTLKPLLPPELLGVYINPDEIESKIKRDLYFHASDYGIDADPEELKEFFKNSIFLVDHTLWKDRDG